jgi:hypothetical protein
MPSWCAFRAHSPTHQPPLVIKASTRPICPEFQPGNTTINSTFVYQFTVPAFLTKRSGTKGLTATINITFPTLILNKENVDQLLENLSWWASKAHAPAILGDSGLKHLPIGNVVKFIDYVVWQTFGHVGTPRGKFRPQGRNIDWRPCRGQITIHHRLERPSFLSAFIARSVSGDIPDIYMTADIPRAAGAMAMQRAYNVFTKTHGDILKCIEELLVSVDERHVRKTILSADTHCTRANEDERYQEAHYCMVCLQLFPCHTMSWTKDGRLVCNQHFKHGHIASDMA